MVSGIISRVYRLTACPHSGGQDTSIYRYDFSRVGQSFDPDPVDTFVRHRVSISDKVTIFLLKSLEGCHQGNYTTHHK
jgi:hypothetical protein